jgi:hypothetical protein
MSHIGWWFCTRGLLRLHNALNLAHARNGTIHQKTLQNEAPNGPQETFKPSMPEGLKDQGHSSHLPGVDRRH